MPAGKLHAKLFNLLRQYCRYRDLRHLVTLAWMVVGLQSLSYC